MSFLKPDFDYNPLNVMYEPPDQQEVSPSKIYESKSILQNDIKQFCKDITDYELYRFYGNSSISFRTNTNVFDSVAFLEKFNDAFIFSLKKNFPEISPESIQEIQENAENFQNSVAKTLKYSNVENKYLLALSLGIIESMLEYENY
jgi:hypothetical protein